MPEWKNEEKTARHESLHDFLYERSGEKDE